MLGTLCGGTHPRLKLRWPQLVRDLPTPSVGRERAGRYVCKPMVFCKSNGEGINSVKVCECGVVGLNLGRLRLESSVDQQRRPGCIPPSGKDAGKSLSSGNSASWISCWQHGPMWPWALPAGSVESEILHAPKLWAAALVPALLRHGPVPAWQSFAAPPLRRLCASR